MNREELIKLAEGYPLTHLKLSTRTYNNLARPTRNKPKIETVADLMKLTPLEVAHIRWIGPKSMEEIEKVLVKFTSKFDLNESEEAEVEEPL